MERYFRASLSPGARSDLNADPRIETPALALYAHIPWCVRKCPYCDFNSHISGAPPPFESYIERLLFDLDQELRVPAARRPLTSCFIGGGTPSLVPGRAIRTLLNGIQARTRWAPEIEITLEANPGTLDHAHFAAYRAAGVNRLSIGVQSLSVRHLKRLGRIHGPEEARSAMACARAVGFERVNLDLIFALPGQSLREAREDLRALLDLAPDHVSYYQLTLEPNTRFHACPPELPDADLAADMGEQGREDLEAAGYRQYEVSAFAREGQQCRHNLNYWRFGDYLGIGAGAHGKLTEKQSARGPWRVHRKVKRRQPRAYLDGSAELLVASRGDLTTDDLLYEFALNALRLTHGFETALWGATTGLPPEPLLTRVAAAEQDGLLQRQDERIIPTELGRRFLNDLIDRFAPP